MDGREIPGFYYDEEKRKYFRIQERKDTATNTNYSKDNVRRKKADAKRRKTEHRQQILQEAQRIKRSKLLTSSVCPCASLRFETGTSHSRGLRQDTRAKAFTAALELRSLRYDSPESHLPMCLEYDQQFDLIITGRSVGARDRTFIEARPVDQFPAVYSDGMLQRHILIDSVTSAVTSLSMSPSRHLAITTWGYTAPPELRVFHVGARIDEQSGLNLPHITREAVLVREEGIPCSAANPFQSESDLTAAFAYGEGRAARLVHLNSVRIGFHQSFPTDVLSLGWKSRDVLAIGCRDKTLRLWDTRGPQHHFVTSRLQREGPVSAIRTVGDSYIALQGEPGCPALYDLRMASATRSKPIVTYRTPSRKDFNRGFDIHESLGLVVHGMFDGTIALNSLWTGEQIRAFKLGNIGTIRFLKFVDSGEGVSILGCNADTEFKLTI